MTVIAIVFLLFASPLAAEQGTLLTQNPMAQLRDAVDGVLEEAELPFTEEQNSAIVLMMEDRRQASEELFGELLDFRAGPTQGQEADRLRSAIDWMENEFLIRLEDFLTPEQSSAWSFYLETSGREALSAEGSPGAEQPSQTQYVRINNNLFTTEDENYRRGRNRGGRPTTEVIERGGVGEFHGNAEFLIGDESLNAGRRFADNKPSYQERQIRFDLGGPVIAGRLTTAFAFSNNRAENVDVIHATLPDDELFSLGITRPTINRLLSLRNTYQLADAHTLTLNVSRTTSSRENQGIGGLRLPERASTSSGRDWNFEVQQFSALSSENLYETWFSVRSSHDETEPVSEGVRINVNGAFSSGGAQNRAETTGRIYDFSNLYTGLGERLTLKMGVQAIYRTQRSDFKNNFLGTYTFSSLETFEEGRPDDFRVTDGDPLSEISQSEFSFFVQNDFKVTPRLTLMYGARYEFQTNLEDHNNLAPRLAIAWAVGQASVIRAGAGMFHQRVLINAIDLQRRFDGTLQREIIISNPSYPELPLVSGTIEETSPSVRVIDTDLATPYNFIVRASFERTFLSNLFISASYDFSREVHRLRFRNLNAPMDITASVPASCKPGQRPETCVRPQPDQGNIINMESTGFESIHTLQLDYRQRFSIFNVTASYTRTTHRADARSGNALTRTAVYSQTGGGGGDNFGFGPRNLPTDNYNLSADWSHLAAATHRVNTTLNARLPLGIFLTGLMAANTRERYTITTGTDDNRDGEFTDRPIGFERNGALASRLLRFDFNISKAFFFGDSATGRSRTNVNLFANMTNAFNRPNYNAPSAVETSPNFGRITGAAAPREIEAGLRFQF